MTSVFIRDKRGEDTCTELYGVMQPQGRLTATGAGKAKTLPPEFSEEHSLPTPRFGTSRLQNFERIHLFFKNFYWGIADLQCCISFRCTAK